MTIVLIDNYDSFTWNLAHQAARLTGTMPVVIRNDAIDIGKIDEIAPQAILISPGPATPNEAGACLSLIPDLCKRKLPVFGVCLGMQIICAYMGAKIIRAQQVAHGVMSKMKHQDFWLYKGVPKTFHAVRYHSLIVDESTLCEEISVNACGPSEIIMGIDHTTLPLLGVQFHTESIASPWGTRILANFFHHFNIACSKLEHLDNEAHLSSDAGDHRSVASSLLV